jgi:hypothetical protein
LAGVFGTGHGPDRGIMIPALCCVWCADIVTGRSHQARAGEIAETTSPNAFSSAKKQKT